MSVANKTLLNSDPMAMCRAALLVLLILTLLRRAVLVSVFTLVILLKPRLFLHRLRSAERKNLFLFSVADAYRSPQTRNNFTNVRTTCKYAVICRSSMKKHLSSCGWLLQSWILYQATPVGKIKIYLTFVTDANRPFLFGAACFVCSSCATSRWTSKNP